MRCLPHPDQNINRCKVSLRVLLLFLWLPAALTWELVPDPPFFYHRGRWAYNAAEGRRLFGHFLYTSPMGKQCKRNLTIAVQTRQCHYDLAGDRSVPADFANSTQCIPQVLEVAAMLVDVANSASDLLVDTCVQVSAVHTRSNAEVAANPLRVVHDAVSAWPTKHGFVAHDFTAQGRGWPDFVAAMGLPLIEVREFDTIRPVSAGPVFRVRSDMAWTLQHIFAQLMPSRIAVLLDAGTAQDTLPAIQSSAKPLNTTLACTEVLPLTDDSAPWEGTINLLQCMVHQQIRYLLIATSPTDSLSRIVCALHVMNLDRHVQLVTIGATMAVYAFMHKTPCRDKAQIDKQWVKEIVYSVGLLGVSSIMHFWSGAAMDHILTLETQSAFPLSNNTQAKDLNGAAFPHFLPSSPPCSDCADDPAVNGSTMLRQLLRKAPGDSLTCREAAPLGHQVPYMPWITVLAQLCPVASCAYNPFGQACRTSCACVRTVPGRAAHPCTNASDLPLLTSSISAGARCDGPACRTLPFAPSATNMVDRLQAYGMNGMGFCSGPWVCSFWSKIGIAITYGPPTVDGVWALVEAFRCVEKRHGAAGLQRLADHRYGEVWVWQALYACMVEDVDFQGIGGRITFRYRQSPLPGDTIPVINAAHQSIDMMTIEGVILKSGTVLAHRTFQRRNVSACKAVGNLLPPGLMCPPGSVEDYWPGRDGPPREALPLGAPSLCPAGSYPLALEESAFMANGSEAPVFACVPCAEGTFKAEESAARCSPCQPGFHAASRGQTLCAACGSNTFSAPAARRHLPLRDGRVQAYGASECLPCRPGFVSELGAANCTPCQAGTSREADAPSCGVCPAGSFQSQPGASVCLSCAAVLPGSTSGRGATSDVECLCPLGTFARPSVGCLPCPEGLECPGGAQAPRQRPGFWGTVADEEYSMMRCRSQLECPAGPVGTCSAGRGDIACARCQPLFYRSGAGECAPCTGQSYWVPVVAFCLLIIVLVVIYILHSRFDPSTQQLSSLTLSALVGQATSAVQVLNAFRQLNIQWTGPAAAVLDAMKIGALDLDLVHLPCLMPGDSPVARFAIQLLALPCCVAVLALGRVLVKRCGRPRDEPHSEMVLFNSVGYLTLTLYIALALAVLGPLQCVQNPNGTHSMVTDPGVICWTSSTHKWMLSMACVGIVLYPVLILAFVVRATVVYPSLLLSGRGHRSLRRWRFLFSRFTTKRYYFAAWYLLRNTLVAIIPVALRGVRPLQLLFMSLLLQFSVMLQVRLWPWRTSLANSSDSFGGLSVSFFLVAGILLAGADQDQAQDLVVQWVLLVSLVLAFASLPLGLLLLMRRRLFSSKKYGAFLCHHQEGGGCLSRLLKMTLESFTGASIFLGADAVESADVTFDIVRCKVGALVVVQTSQVLKRIWCAGEIAIAYSNKVPIVLVNCDGCQPITEQELRGLEDWWNDEELNILLSFGISLESIREAYQHLAAQTALDFPRFGSLAEKSRVVEDLVLCCKLPKRKLARRIAEGVRPRILLVGATADPEGCSACEILAVNLQVALEMETLVVRSADQLKVTASSAKSLVVVLTKGVLEDPVFAAVLVSVLHSEDLRLRKVQVVTVLADPAFAFPNASFFARLAAEGLAGLGNVDGEQLCAVYHVVLSVLALPFSPLGSSNTIAFQVLQVARRLRNNVSASNDLAARTRTFNRPRSQTSGEGEGRPEKEAEVTNAAMSVIPSSALPTTTTPAPSLMSSQLFATGPPPAPRSDLGPM